MMARLRPEQEHVFPNQEFFRTHHKNEAPRCDVHKTDGDPTMFVDVLWQKVGSDTGPTTAAHLAFHACARSIDPNVELYLIWLAIDGKGAVIPPQKYALRKNAHGQYDMTKADLFPV